MATGLPVAEVLEGNGPIVEFKEIGLAVHLRVFALQRFDDRRGFVDVLDVIHADRDLAELDDLSLKLAAGASFQHAITDSCAASCPRSAT